ncbi:uncharacterized protein LOC142979568 [Anticarsia gemmatalis]|uniref:uncharacterized protein LOC142979568 n=1 Tax=Anticarsia gemmatalis TaxID=129554 RepID=UPI003F7742C7
MSCSVLLCLLVTCLIPMCPTHSVELRYECGPHGRFEYCIDNIPGCVIGCHCHPGYYFDTDTKICEPNTKLTEDFRRRYLAEPNRNYPINTPPIVDKFPTPTTPDTIIERTGGTSKDSDDLGDWLYNQFFKTIESQVINKTNDNHNSTRRSGSGTMRAAGGTRRGAGRKTRPRGEDANENKVRRKARRSWRSRSRKKKSKVHGLRRKLLRITEDDSLFESDSSSESDSDSSDSSDESESSSTETTDDTDKDNDREHGHKKVVIFNRRPRPPLPSFIFLPNSDTPYYPPIGLPPPPVLPMYPIVPVPPMAPPCPSIGTTKAADNSVATTTDAPNGSDAPTSDPTHDTDNPEATTEVPTNPVRRNKGRGHRARRPPLNPKPVEDTIIYRAGDPDPRMTSEQAQRVKLMKKIRERLKMKHKPPSDFNAAEGPEDELPTVDNNSYLEQSRRRTSKENSPVLNDVNFKYISELIHRMNPKGPKAPPFHLGPDLKPSDNYENSRRNYDLPMSNIQYVAVTTTPKYKQDPNDAYFSNLGRQIASLIRSADSKIDNNVGREQNVLQQSAHTVLNENSFPPRSFWERTVRSPLSKLKKYFGELYFTKQSNEQDLLSLENEVNLVASTSPPLSLLDLENILNTLQKSPDKPKKYRSPTVPSNASFNVNLLPMNHDRRDYAYRKSYDPPNYTEFTPSPPEEDEIYIKQETKSPHAPYYLEPTNVHLPVFSNNVIDSQNPNRQFSNALQPPLRPPEREIENNTLQSPEYSNFMPKITDRPYMDHKLVPKKTQEEYLKFLKRNQGFNNTVVKPFDQRPVQHQTRPAVVKYKALNYFSEAGNNHHYMFEASYPITLKTFGRRIPKRFPSEQPSYFHHELHHFDYID